MSVRNPPPLFWGVDATLHSPMAQNIFTKPLKPSYPIFSPILIRFSFILTHSHWFSSILMWFSQILIWLIDADASRYICVHWLLDCPTSVKYGWRCMLAYPSLRWCDVQRKNAHLMHKVDTVSFSGYMNTSYVLDSNKVDWCEVLIQTVHTFTIINYLHHLNHCHSPSSTCHSLAWAFQSPSLTHQSLQNHQPHSSKRNSFQLHLQ